MAKEDPETIRATCLAAERGDKAAAKKVKEWSKSWSIETVHTFSSLANQVRNRAAATALGGENAFSFSLMRREAELTGDMILRPNASSLEKLLAEQVGIDWLTLRIAELFLAEAYGPEADRWQHRVDSAHRRLTRSIKTLAQVQRLQIPNLVQVNIAEQNVNLTP